MSSSVGAIIIVSFVFALALMLVIWVIYRYLQKEQDRLGSIVAKKLRSQHLLALALRVVILIGIGGLLSLFHPEIETFFIFMLLTSIVEAIQNVRLLLTCPIDEHILVNLEQNRDIHHSKVIPYFWGIIFTLACVMLFWGLTEDWSQFIVLGMLLLWFIACEAATNHKSQHLITEQGIVKTPRLIRWQDIEEYLWGKSTEAGKTTLILRIKSRWLAFLNYKEMHIPTEHKAAVNHYLNQYVHDKAVVDIAPKIV